MTTRVPSKASHSLAVSTLSIVPNTPLKIELMTYFHEQAATIIGSPLSSLTLRSRCAATALRPLVNPEDSFIGRHCVALS